MNRRLIRPVATLLLGLAVIVPVTSGCSLAIPQVEQPGEDSGEEDSADDEGAEDGGEDESEE